jgi:hypothetical protein
MQEDYTIFFPSKFAPLSLIPEEEEESDASGEGTDCNELTWNTLCIIGMMGGGPWCHVGRCGF